MSFFFAQMGPFRAPMLLLAVLVVALAAWRTAQLGRSSTPLGPEVESGINSILFWGVVSALVGFLGFFSGVYASLRGVAGLESAGPRLIARGVEESLTVSIFGLVILVVAAVAWFALRSRYLKLQSSAQAAA